MQLTAGGNSRCSVASVSVLILLSLSFAFRVCPGTADLSFGFSAWKLLTDNGVFRHAFITPIAFVGVVGVVAVIWYTVSRKVSENESLRLSVRRILESKILQFVAWLLLLSTFWLLQTTVILGDGIDIVRNLDTPAYTSTRWYLSYQIISIFYRVVGKNLGFSALESLRLISSLSGATTAILTLKIADELFDDRMNKLLYAWLFPSAYGVIQLWFGYAEIYPVVTLGWAILIWAYLRVINGKMSLRLASVLTGIVYLLYLGNVLIVPAYVFLLFVTLRRYPDVKSRVYELALSGVFLLGPILLLIFYKFNPRTFYKFWQSQVASSNIVRGTSSASIFYSVHALISRQHLIEILSEWSLLDSTGFVMLLVSPVLWLCLKNGRTQINRTKLVLLLVITGPYIAYSFLMEPLLGYPQDWDLFSYIALFISLCGQYLFLLSREHLPGFRWLYAFSVATGWFHTLSVLLGLHLLVF